MNSAAPQFTAADLDDPFYYLRNFEVVLEWVVARYGDLLDQSERDFVAVFRDLPRTSRGLLVRMVMRKGDCFRADKLNYPELGETVSAAVPLLEQGWLESDPALELAELFRLFTKNELAPALAARLEAAGVSLNAGKADWHEALERGEPAPLSAAGWGVHGATLYRLTVMPLCERFRLMFFGNLRQDWREFVLAELGTFQYEPVAFPEASRPFASREEVDLYLYLHDCRRLLEEEEPLDRVEACLPPRADHCDWLAQKHDKLVFRLAREYERAGALDDAGRLYRNCRHPGARGRLLRVMELQSDYRDALALAERALEGPESEAELQQLGRLVPRLTRKLGLPPPPATGDEGVEILELTLDYSGPVELAVCEHLHTEEAPVHYVENSLLTGLFGLLCREAIFAPLPGAFFHPFQSGPADLHRPDFYHRRRTLFENSLGMIRDGRYREIILENFEQSRGRLSPFAHWGILSRELIEQALDCIPGHHLELCFRRLLRDLKANRSGLPDLICFRPSERDYRMIEVKGPGDRLQDNQRRWIRFFREADMPVVVCRVSRSEVPLS